MALLLLAAMLTPLMPAIELDLSWADVTSKSSSSSSGGNSYSWTYIDVFDDGHNTVYTDNVDRINISGDGYIHADNANITVEGDYYIADFQFNPHVGEIWAGNNNKTWSTPCLYNDGSAMLDKATMSALLRHNDYAILYEGFMDLESRGPYKPEGATRAGEILGYDIYARRGEFFREADGDIRREDGGILTPTSNVSSMWAIINTYRAVGVELRNVNAKVYNRWVDEDRRAIAAIRGREWDINGSPVVERLTGNLIATYDGDAKPVIEAYISRTDPKLYLDRFTQVDRMSWVSNMPTANELTGEVNADADSKYITLGEFCVLVQHMMETYGEPVIIDQEKLMLLEAYGRVMPHYLSPVQYDAVEYLMCRGIITETDMPWQEWVTFEDATEILMRVKDVDSRHTFKQIQLTADVSLLEKDYYPTNVEVSTEDSIAAEVSDIAYENAKHYDYFVELNDDTTFRDKNGNAVQPYVCESKDGYAKPLENAVYLGVYDFGSSKYYRFQVPIGAQSNGRVWVNTTDPNGDKPGQLSLEYGGGWYHSVAGSIVRGPHDSIELSRTDFSPNDSVMWVDTGRFSEAAKMSDKLRADVASAFTHLVQIPRYLVARVTVDGKSWDVNNKACWDKESGGVSVKYDSQASNAGFECFVVKGAGSLSAAKALFVVTPKDGVSENENAFGVFEAYAQKNSRFLLSTEYLKSIGVLQQFTRVGDKKYYGVFKTTINRKTISYDVYINTGGDNPICVVGTQATKYPSNYVLIQEKLGGEYLIDSSIISGRVKEDINITDSEGNVVVRPLRVDLYEEGEAATSNTGTEVSTWRLVYPSHMEYKGSISANLLVYEQGDMSYLFAPYTYVLSNWVVVEDFSEGLYVEGSNPVATMFSLYEQGTPVPEDERGPRNELERILDVKLGSDSIKVFQYSAQPLSTLGDPLYRSPDGDLYIRIPEYKESWGTKTLEEYFDGLRSSKQTWSDVDNPPAYTVPIRRLVPTAGTDNPRYMSMNFNMGHIASHPDGEWKPYVRGGYTYASVDGVSQQVTTFYDISKADVYTDFIDSSWVAGFSPQTFKTYIGTHGNKSGANHTAADGCTIYQTSNCDICKVLEPGTMSVKYAVCGAAPLLAGCAVPWGELGSLYGSNNLYIMQGSDRVLTYDNSTKYSTLTDVNANKNAMAFLVKTSSSAAYLQCTAFQFTATDGSFGTNVVPEKPTYGESNKITDWLLWLKEAKLSDAEDILTICIVAVLSWLPRLFMALFLLLMCLAMIANVKPWASFCDKVFDPYKFLTGGRQTVHTINIKTTFLWSMIALALFGLFQNGLILELIAWIVRAIVGIMNR